MENPTDMPEDKTIGTFESPIKKFLQDPCLPFSLNIIRKMSEQELRFIEDIEDKTIRKSKIFLSLIRDDLLNDLKYYIDEMYKDKDTYKFPKTISLYKLLMQYIALECEAFSYDKFPTSLLLERIVFALSHVLDVPSDYYEAQSRENIIFTILITASRKFPVTKHLWDEYLKKKHDLSRKEVYIGKPILIDELWKRSFYVKRIEDYGTDNEEDQDDTEESLNEKYFDQINSKIRPELIEKNHIDENRYTVFMKSNQTHDQETGTKFTNRLDDSSVKGNSLKTSPKKSETQVPDTCSKKSGVSENKQNLLTANTVLNILLDKITPNNKPKISNLLQTVEADLISDCKKVIGSNLSSETPPSIEIYKNREIQNQVLSIGSRDRIQECTDNNFNLPFQEENKVENEKLNEDINHLIPNKKKLEETKPLLCDLIREMLDILPKVKEIETMHLTCSNIAEPDNLNLLETSCISKKNEKLTNKPNGAKKIVRNKGDIITFKDTAIAPINPIEIDANLMLKKPSSEIDIKANENKTLEKHAENRVTPPHQFLAELKKVESKTDLKSTPLYTNSKLPNVFNENKSKSTLKVVTQSKDKTNGVLKGNDNNNIISKAHKTKIESCSQFVNQGETNLCDTNEILRLSETSTLEKIETKTTKLQNEQSESLKNISNEYNDLSRVLKDTNKISHPKELDILPKDKRSSNLKENENNFVLSGTEIGLENEKREDPKLRRKSNTSEIMGLTNPDTEPRKFEVQNQLSSNSEILKLPLDSINEIITEKGTNTKQNTAFIKTLQNKEKLDLKSNENNASKTLKFSSHPKDELTLEKKIISAKPHKTDIVKQKNELPCLRPQDEEPGSLKSNKIKKFIENNDGSTVLRNINKISQPKELGTHPKQENTLNLKWNDDNFIISEVYGTEIGLQNQKIENLSYTIKHRRNRKKSKTESPNVESGSMQSKELNVSIGNDEESKILENINTTLQIKNVPIKKMLKRDKCNKRSKNISSAAKLMKLAQSDTESKMLEAQNQCSKPAILKLSSDSINENNMESMPIIKSDLDYTKMSTLPNKKTLDSKPIILNFSNKNDIFKILEFGLEPKDNTCSYLEKNTMSSETHKTDNVKQKNELPCLKPKRKLEMENKSSKLQKVDLESFKSNELKVPSAKKNSETEKPFSLKPEKMSKTEIKTFNLTNMECGISNSNELNVYIANNDGNKVLENVNTPSQAEKAKIMKIIQEVNNTQIKELALKKILKKLGADDISSNDDISKVVAEKYTNICSERGLDLTTKKVSNKTEITNLKYQVLEAQNKLCSNSEILDFSSDSINKIITEKETNTKSNVLNISNENIVNLALQHSVQPKDETISYKRKIEDTKLPCSPNPEKKCKTETKTSTKLPNLESGNQKSNEVHVSNKVESKSLKNIDTAPMTEKLPSKKIKKEVKIEVLSNIKIITQKPNSKFFYKVSKDDQPCWLDTKSSETDSATMKLRNSKITKECPMPKKLEKTNSTTAQDYDNQRITKHFKDHINLDTYINVTSDSRVASDIGQHENTDSREIIKSGVIFKIRPKTNMSDDLQEANLPKTSDTDNLTMLSEVTSRQKPLIIDYTNKNINSKKSRIRMGFKNKNSSSKALKEREILNIHQDIPQKKPTNHCIDSILSSSKHSVRCDVKKRVSFSECSYNIPIEDNGVKINLRKSWEMSCNKESIDIIAVPQNTISSVTDNKISNLSSKKKPRKLENIVNYLSTQHVRVHSRAEDDNKLHNNLSTENLLNPYGQILEERRSRKSNDSLNIGNCVLPAVLIGDDDVYNINMKHVPGTSNKNIFENNILSMLREEERLIENLKTTNLDYVNNKTLDMNALNDVYCGFVISDNYESLRESGRVLEENLTEFRTPITSHRTLVKGGDEDTFGGPTLIQIMKNKEEMVGNGLLDKNDNLPDCDEFQLPDEVFPYFVQDNYYTDSLLVSENSENQGKKQGEYLVNCLLPMNEANGCNEISLDHMQNRQEYENAKNFNPFMNLSLLDVNTLVSSLKDNAVEDDPKTINIQSNQLYDLEDSNRHPNKDKDYDAELEALLNSAYVLGFNAQHEYNSASAWTQHLSKFAIDSSKKTALPKKGVNCSKSKPYPIASNPVEKRRAKKRAQKELFNLFSTELNPEFSFNKKQENIIIQEGREMRDQFNLNNPSVKKHPLTHKETIEEMNQYSKTRHYLPSFNKGYVIDMEENVRENGAM